MDLDINSIANQVQQSGGSLPSPSVIFFGLVFSVIGFGYLAYGRKQNFAFVIAGICLLAFSFFSFDFTTYLILGVIFIVAPFIFAKFFRD